MESSEASRLDSALRRGLKRIEGLPMSARVADESITKYLRQKFGEILLSEYRRRSYRNEDDATIAERTNQILDGVVLDAQKLYSLFELHMNKQLDGFWEELDLGGKTKGASGTARDVEKAVFTVRYSTSAPRDPMGGRRFHCTEGCVFEGERAYLEHRDRGHHPIPA
jgi:hypothetical protein